MSFWGLKWEGWLRKRYSFFGWKKTMCVRYQLQRHNLLLCIVQQWGWSEKVKRSGFDWGRLWSAQEVGFILKTSGFCKSRTVWQLLWRLWSADCRLQVGFFFTVAIWPWLISQNGWYLNLMDILILWTSCFGWYLKVVDDSNWLISQSSWYL